MEWLAVFVILGIGTAVGLLLLETFVASDWYDD